ncbi:M40J, histidine kinase-group XI protein [Xylogone sp. PMI_703]|nr:M40J, histidine kinase-group XI protein [Xylogone sp. PMI_703]
MSWAKRHLKLIGEEQSGSGAADGAAGRRNGDASNRRRGLGTTTTTTATTNGRAKPDFAAVGAVKLLEVDPRPTFVLDIHHPVGDGLNIVFANHAFRSDQQLYEQLQRSPLLPSTNGLPQDPKLLFQDWARCRPSPNSHSVDCHSWMGFNWTSFMIQDHWKVISGVAMKDHGLPTPDTPPSGEAAQEPPAQQKNISPINSLPSPPTTLGSPETPTFRSVDWTVETPDPGLSPHLMLVRTVDWGKTTYGPMGSWTPEFRELANLAMYTPHPVALFWGAELTMMYNQSYAEDLAGQQHPNLLGAAFRGLVKDIWGEVSGVFEESMRTGRSIMVRDQMLPLARRGFVEETFFSWSLTPIYGANNVFLGLYHAAFETTRLHLTDRRTKTLLKLGEQVALARSVSEFWQIILDTLQENEYDFPFALLYSILDDTDVEEDASSISSSSSHMIRSCVLEGSLGVPAGHNAAPTRIDLNRSKGGFIPVFREAMKTREPKILDIEDGILADLIDGLEWRGFGEPCRQSVVCPIRPTTSENVMGFLMIGVNPRRPYDDDYKSFISLLNRQLATSLASVTLFEEEINRGYAVAQAATIEHFKLSEELAIQKSRLQRIAEVSPVGMFSVDQFGTLLGANDRWFEMTGHLRDNAYEKSWMDTVAESSRPTIEDGWKTLSIEGLPWTGELQLRSPRQDPTTGQEVAPWVLAEAQPEFTKDGEIRGVMGSFTDITLQKRSAEDALSQAKLSEQLLIRTQEAEQNERNFKRFSDLSPGGLVILDLDTKITYANSQWFNISGHPTDQPPSSDSLSWVNTIYEEDLPLFKEKWEEMLETRKTVTMEVRMSNEWQGLVGGTMLNIPRWVLGSISPEISDDGEVLSIMGCITDISRIKWAEGLQNRRLQEAEETRRQQNSFIDITSHEMRNPLSAILQCAEGISTSLNENWSSQAALDPNLASSLKFCIEAAETIQLCAQHQKSIVDDILTISKVDSNLLAITPVPMHPVAAIQRAMKIFTAEFQLNKIEHEFIVEDSYKELEVDMVMLDTSRLFQVLINLLTNAIKFTKEEKTKSIKVFLNAYREVPGIDDDSEFEYFPTRKIQSYATIGDDWGKGEILYLRFKVQDTGCGLTKDEKKSLFTRFSQASPRTHVHYGGSGLGLFIARQLVELQGGEIGVASQSGVGSTFAFYVKVRRAEPQINEVPEDSNELDGHTSIQQETGDLNGLTRNESRTSIVDLSENLPAGKITIPLSRLQEWHILIVEDNLVNQRVLATQIRKLGCTVYVANHGQEALEVLKGSKYYKGNEADGKELSIILMDWEMPVMDGLTCARRIREMQKEGEITAHVPIIAVTANARSEQIAAAKDSGMDDVMPKPFKVNQLMPKIDSLLQAKGD